MANINISDSHSDELEYLYTALTDEEQASIQGGIKFPSLSQIKKIGRVAKKVGKYVNAGVNAVYVATGAKAIHDKKGHWWSFL